MSLTRTGQAALAIWLAAAAIGAVMCGEPPAGSTEPEPRMQEAIEEAVSAIARQDGTAADRVASLKSLAAGRRPTLLMQMALYLEKSDGTERSMAGALLLRELAFTPREMIGALAPHLDGARPELRRVLTEMLATIDRREAGEADFQVYESWLAGHGAPPPASLVRYLYGTSPDAALACMRHVYGGPDSRQQGDGALGDLKEILAGRDASRTWTSQERARALAALETLSRDPAWYVRRFAAEILSDNPEFGTPALVQRLKDDPEPLVRDALAP